MASSLKKFLLLPSIIKLSAKVPRDRHVAWDRYWGKIQSSGVEGDVLWDAGTDHELAGYLDTLRQFLDGHLPLVDVGCGHGRYTNLLVNHFPRVVGVDVSANAIAQAQASAQPGTQFHVADFTAPGIGAELARTLGDANVFVRGVFHVLNPASRIALAQNLRSLVGSRGRVFLVETDFRGDGLAYIDHLGGTAGNIPAPLKLAIGGLPKPGHFGLQERQETFDQSEWTVLEEGSATIETVPLQRAGIPERIPGYFAVLEPTP
ncbi:class I SAM-dependent methyltransferase [Arthrobacter sp. H5]|uniref:class I SAM-dependent methyltransferase n=1 Tax=Arthrobacter sp. H5 TaxID=1267973 RepID=UPI0004880817|nr:class I SAM-dependent methyltransferase [Arthrobacter sp. H5]